MGERRRGDGYDIDMPCNREKEKQGQEDVILGKEVKKFTYPSLN